MKDVTIPYYDDRRGGRRPRTLRVYRPDVRRGYVADFRAFSDVGGKLVPLRPRGAHFATLDPVVAKGLAEEHLAEYQRRRRDGWTGTAPPVLTLGDAIDEHLKRLAVRPRGRHPGNLARHRHAWTALLETLGGPTARSRAVTVLTVAALTRHVTRRRAQGRSEQTILNELHVASSLARYLTAAGYLVENPVVRVKELEGVAAPVAEATWLELSETAALLEAAHALDTRADRRRCPYLHPLVATAAYTGMRRRELFGLEVEDVDFRRRVVRVQSNQWRGVTDGLKSANALREVPLWPALAVILREHVARWRPTSLLFPAHDAVTLRPYRSLEVALARAVERAGLTKPVTWHTLRHTYCAHRLVTAPGGVYPSTWDVACELGHRDEELIRRRYGHVLVERDRLKAPPQTLEYVVGRVLPMVGRQRRARGHH